MEILINELSLTGQFATETQFISKALLPLSSLLKELDNSQDTLLKKQDFWQVYVTPTKTLHDILTTQTDETTRFKSLLANLIGEPFWESSQKHLATDTYLYSGTNLYGQSLAETVERDKIVISFIHTDFARTKLSVAKNTTIVEIDNLFEKGHYIEVAYQRKTLPYSNYFERKFDNGRFTLLDNIERFRQTNRIEQGQRVYQEISTNNYWYLDNLHKTHYEVYNAKAEHLGEASLQGNLDESKKVNGRMITI
ncbi:hypothetical protein AGMMS49965_01230 [Bacteroidia bacterium]|nr:hypothetical protein AGMMS49965_01230 [Bacteroidia bacterium]